jgi:hypothetical protein
MAVTHKTTPSGMVTTNLLLPTSCDTCEWGSAVSTTALTHPASAVGQTGSRYRVQHGQPATWQPWLWWPWPRLAQTQHGR